MILTRCCRRLFHYSNLHHLKGAKQKSSIKQEPPELQEHKPSIELISAPSMELSLQSEKLRSPLRARPILAMPSQAVSAHIPYLTHTKDRSCRAVTDLPQLCTAPSYGNSREEEGSEISLQHCFDAPAKLQTRCFHRSGAATSGVQHSWGLLGNHRSNKVQFLIRAIYSLNKGSIQQRR